MVRSHGGEVDGNEVLGKYSRLPPEQIEFVPKATRETVRTIDRGIVFLVAFWSAPALKGFATLTDELNRIGLGQLRFVVADLDGADDLRRLPEVGNTLINGDGKALWIRGGKVIGVATPIDGRWDRRTLKRLFSDLTPI